MQTQFMYKLEQIDDEGQQFLEYFESLELAWTNAEWEINGDLVCIHHRPLSASVGPWHLYGIHDGKLYDQPSFVVTQLRSKSIPE